MKEEDKQALIDITRRALWVAFSWNDHNFKKNPEEYLKEEAGYFGINNIDDANKFFDRIDP